MSINLVARIAGVADYNLLQTPTDTTYKIIGDDDKSNIDRIEDYKLWMQTTNATEEEIKRHYTDLLKAEELGVLEFYAI